MTLAEIYVLPTTLTNLTATDSSGNVATLSDFTLTSEGYYMEIGTGHKLQCGEITFESDGYVTQTVECLTDSAYEITLNEVKMITVKEGTTVYWQVSKTDYVTQSGSEVINSDVIKNIVLESAFTPETRTFSYTGDVQTYTVPSGCGHIIVDAVGARGGKSNYVSAGLGGRVQCTLTVSAGQILNIYVGGQGTDGDESTYSRKAGGWNGGGEGGDGTMMTTNGGYGGGGATDIRIGGTELTNRVVVAGGAGGSGYALGTGRAVGGAGGGLIGGSGNNVSGFTFIVATGGTQTDGGVCAYISGLKLGEDGSLGNGGNSSYYGAGGGGGYYGGGSGDNSATGGGGSSYTDPTLCTDVTHTQGYASATGNGWLTITTAV